MAEMLLKSDNSIKLDFELLSKAVIRLMKQSIFEKFMQSGTLSLDDQEFCDKIDCYPVDEFELKEKYVEKLKSSKKLSGKSMTVDEFNKFCDSL